MNFDREIIVYVTANTDTERRLWVERFENLFVNCTLIDGPGVRGSWKDSKNMIWREPVTLVSHLYKHDDPDRTWKWYELDQLLRNYKREAKQEAVLTVTRVIDGKLLT
jgi:hypothetical protein